jgi:predicted NBD/HSP70 family sugar kinase
MVDVGSIGDDFQPELSRGTNQSGVRLYNERLVLSLIRQHGSLPKADLARLTGLSPPTVSQIVGQLEADGLLRREAPQRGRIGQPSVPLSLNPDGALAFGVKIGRRSCDIVLMDFVGDVRRDLHLAYPYPSPAAVVDFVREACEGLLASLSEKERSRIAGLGIAAPFELWNWEREVGAAPGAMQDWRDFDLQSEVARLFGFPVYLCNDATAGCAAEYLLGRAAKYPEFLYIFIAWFIGGGIVINGNLFPGRSGYAGSVGQTLVPVTGEDGKVVIRQLLHTASIYRLEQRLAETGGDPKSVADDAGWKTIADETMDAWIEEVARGIAYALVSAQSVVDFQAAILDGAMPPDVRSRIVERVRERFGEMERTGLPPLAIVEGLIGYRARAIGGASLPFLAKFMRDRELLFRDPGDARAAASHATRPSAF